MQLLARLGSIFDERKHHYIPTTFRLQFTILSFVVKLFSFPVGFYFSSLFNSAVNGTYTKFLCARTTFEYFENKKQNRRYTQRKYSFGTLWRRSHDKMEILDSTLYLTHSFSPSSWLTFPFWIVWFWSISMLNAMQCIRCDTIRNDEYFSIVVSLQQPTSDRHAQTLLVSFPFSCSVSHLWFMFQYSFFTICVSDRICM